MTVEIMLYEERRVFDMTTNAMLFGARAESKSYNGDPTRFDINVMIIGLSAEMGKNHAHSVLRFEQLPFNIQPINPVGFSPESVRNDIMTLDATSKQEHFKKIDTVLFNGHIILMDELNHANDEFIYHTAKTILDIDKYNTLSKRGLSADKAENLKPSLFVHCLGQELEKRVRRAMYEIWVESYLRTKGDSVFQHSPLRYIKHLTLGHNFIDELPDNCHSINFNNYGKVREIIKGLSVISVPEDSVGYYVIVEPSITYLESKSLEERLFYQLRNADCHLIFAESTLEHLYMETCVRRPDIYHERNEPARSTKQAITVEEFLGIK